MRFNILDLIPFLLGIQNKCLDTIYKQNTPTKVRHKGHKTFITAHTTIELNAVTNQKAKETTASAKKILKKYLKEPKKLLQFIESKGTMVIAVPHVEKILRLIKEEEGFLTPVSGVKALILTLGINILSPGKIAIGLRTPDMFLVRSMDLNIFSLAHQFHHWIGYKKQLPGYDDESIRIFKNIWILDNTPGSYEKLSLDDILSLKDAIARDKEAIDFVQEFAREHAGSKQALKNIKDGKKISV